jgi:hypothetical protein
MTEEFNSKLHIQAEEGKDNGQLDYRKPGSEELHPGPINPEE